MRYGYDRYGNGHSGLLTRILQFNLIFSDKSGEQKYSAGFPAAAGCGLGAMHPKSARVNPERGSPEHCEGKIATATFGLKEPAKRLTDLKGCFYICCFAFSLASISAVYGQEPRKTEDPEAGARHAGRGTPRENAAFEEHSIPSEKAKKDAKQDKDGYKRIFLPSDGEVTESLSPDERPASRLLKKKQDSRKPQHQNRVENPWIRNPEEFTVEYDLQDDAEVSVAILGPGGITVRRYTILPGQQGGRKGKNKVIYWDGRDMAGNEVPPGRYFAFQFISYESKNKKDNGKRETRTVPLHKKEK